MKAKYYIIALLITALTGALTVNAQSVKISPDRSEKTVNKGHDKNQNRYVTQNNASNQGFRPGEKNQSMKAERTGMNGKIYSDPKHISISNNNNPLSRYNRPNETVKKGGE